MTTLAVCIIKVLPLLILSAEEATGFFLAFSAAGTTHVPWAYPNMKTILSIAAVNNPLRFIWFVFDSENKNYLITLSSIPCSWAVSQMGTMGKSLAIMVITIRTPTMGSKVSMISTPVGL